jgi:chorismate mutase
MSCRAVRGAITVKENSEEEISLATVELLRSIIGANAIVVDDIVSVLFTVTKDINAQFPATAARRLGWKYVPMLCSYEIDVKKSMKKCIRVLLTFNSNKKQEEIHHQYLRDAEKLRADLVQKKGK